MKSLYFFLLIFIYSSSLAMDRSDPEIYTVTITNHYSKRLKLQITPALGFSGMFKNNDIITIEPNESKTLSMNKTNDYTIEDLSHNTKIRTIKRANSKNLRFDYGPTTKIGKWWHETMNK